MKIVKDDFPDLDLDSTMNGDYGILSIKYVRRNDMINIIGWKQVETVPATSKPPKDHVITYNENKEEIDRYLAVQQHSTKKQNGNSPDNENSFFKNIISKLKRYPLLFSASKFKLGLNFQIVDDGVSINCDKFKSKTVNPKKIAVTISKKEMDLRNKINLINSINERVEECGRNYFPVWNFLPRLLDIGFSFNRDNETSAAKLLEETRYKRYLKTAKTKYSPNAQHLIRETEKIQAMATEVFSYLEKTIALRAAILEYMALKQEYPHMKAMWCDPYPRNLENFMKK